MVDHGLAGIAKKLRLMVSDLDKEAGPTELLISRLSGLLLFVQRMQCASKYSEIEKEDLLAYAGVPLKKTQIPDSQFLIDEWIFLFHTKEREENLWVVRHWFYGSHSHRMGLFLEYQFNRFLKMKSYQTGRSYRSGVRFYPSASPVRITEIQDREYTNAQEWQLQSMSLVEMLDHYARVVSLNPFIQQYAYSLKACTFLQADDVWFITDDSRQMVRISNTIRQIQQILAWSAEGNSILIGELEEGIFSIHAILAKSTLNAIE